MHKHLLIILLLAFATSLSLPTAAQEQQHSYTYIELEIKGLACPYCAFGMEKELKKISEVKDVEIVLKTGKAYISMPKKQAPSKENLVKIIEDAGFTAGEIHFQDHPFDIKKE